MECEGTDPLADITDGELRQAIDDLLGAGVLTLGKCPCCGGVVLVPAPQDPS